MRFSIGLVGVNLRSMERETITREVAARRVTHVDHKRVMAREVLPDVMSIRRPAMGRLRTVGASAICYFIDRR